jgi:hypothetical protein
MKVAEYEDKCLTKAEAVPLHATRALGERGVAPTHSRPRH